MADHPSVLLSGFADECAFSKSATEQLAVFAALGLQYYSLRFVDVGGGVKNVMQLSNDEIDRLLALNETYGMKVATLGSPIGKVKLRDVEDGTKNRYVEFEDYLEGEVTHAIRLAHRVGTKLIRGFSFYHPRNDDPLNHMAQATDQIARITERCAEEGLVYGLEIEANLVGQNGETMARLYDGVNHPNLVLIFDGGNLSSQNISPEGCFQEYLKMRHGIGWMHVKDYKIDPNLKWEGHVDEERLKNFVPCDRGDSGHAMIFQDFATVLPEKTAKMQALGAPGVFMDLEPHVRAGGQFGGFSGPDGMGIALRALCYMLSQAGISYNLRDFATISRLS